MRTIVCVDTSEAVSDYGYYLQTRHWAHLRAMVRTRGVCDVCGQTITHEFDAHHRTYATTLEIEVPREPTAQ